MSINPTILKANGEPAFVVLTYQEYQQLVSQSQAPGRIPADGTTPHEVMRLAIKNDWSLIRAWREHLGLTQTDIAQRLSIRQPSYAAMERTDANLKKITLERIAAAMGLLSEQLEF